MIEQNNKTPSQNDPTTSMPAKESELKLRVISAIILGGLALYLTYVGLLGFALLIVIIMMALVYEWHYLIGFKNYYYTLVSIGVGIGSILTIELTNSFYFAIGLFGSGFLLTFLIGFLSTPEFSPRDSLKLPISRWAMIGLLYIMLPLLAMIWLYSEKQIGVLSIFFIYGIVWGADSGAYFTGRAIGGPKLAPKISPNKTWSGFLGGVSAAIIIAVCFVTLSVKVIGETSILMIMLIAIYLAICAQIGDLVESALKRHFGIKDSSNLIPGHGGVFDRVDGLIFAALGAAILALFKSPSTPASALLIWG